MDEWIELTDAERTVGAGEFHGVLLYLLIPYHPQPQATIGWWDAYHGCFRHFGEDGTGDIQPTHYQPLNLPYVPPSEEKAEEDGIFGVFEDEMHL